MDLITVDFETYYSKTFSLGKLTTEEYIRSPDFEVIGVGVKVNDGETRWITGTNSKIETTLYDQYDWENSAVLAHNTLFDGAILSWIYGITPKIWFDTLGMARAIHGVDVGGSLAKLSQRYKLGEKGTEIVNALGKRRVDFTDEDLARYGEYCINDVELTYKLFQKMFPVFPKKELKVIDMTLRMFTDPQLVLDTPKLEAHLQSIRDSKDAVLEKCGIDKADLMSNNKFAEALRSLGVEPPTKISARTGKETYAFAKADPGLKELQEHENPDVQALVAARTKLKSTLEETRTERFISIANRGMLPVPIKYYAAHCLTGDAEVLTPKGWVALKDWGGGSIVQWSPTGIMNFANATANEFFVDEPLVVYNSRYHQARYTLGHTIPTFSGRGVFSTGKAGSLAEKRFELPISGLLGKRGRNSLTSLDARLAVMIQADGAVSVGGKRGTCVRFGFTKARKVKRCLALLRKAEVTPHVTVEPSGVTRIFVRAAEAPVVQKALCGTAEKMFSEKLLSAPLSTKEAFIAELKYWDGWEEPAGGLNYTTCNKTNAEFVHTMAHLVGKSAHITHKTRQQNNWNTGYKVYIRNNSRTRVLPEHAGFKDYTGRVYCPTTKTGYFLFRQNGHIAVTGNTGRWGGLDSVNLQNLPSRGENAKVLKSCICAPEGHTLVEADSAQIEARVLAWLAEQNDLVKAFEDGKDVYVKMASQIYDTPEEKVEKNQRFIGKSAILGCGYGMGHKRFREQLASFGVAIEEHEAQRIIEVYRGANGEIKRFWRDAQNMLLSMYQGDVSVLGRGGLLRTLPKHNAVRLPSDLLLFYPQLKAEEGEKGLQFSYWQNRMKSWTYVYGGKVVENICQAIARCVMAEQMLMISKRYSIALTVHDSVVCCVPDAEVAEAAEYISECMRWTPEWASGLPVRGDVEIGPNYGECIEWQEWKSNQRGPSVA